MEHILFCNIAYMKYYDFDLHEETPRHGGKYVALTGDALEKNNFHKCDDDKFRGFVETKYRDGYESGQRPNKIRLENFNPSYISQDKINGVTVIFCAKSDLLNKHVIVGWYRNATVYRDRCNYKERQYNLECDINDAYLLDETDRTFTVPRAAREDFGIGTSNLWYAKEERATEWLCSVREYVNGYYTPLYEVETNPQVLPKEYRESGIGKKVWVNKYERNANARRKCLETYGTNCAICGFDSHLVYGDGFENRIEVHHIIPINQINDEYQIDPLKDLIPVCPNCHTMLHTKMHNGEYPTIDFLKSRIDSSKK